MPSFYDQIKSLNTNSQRVVKSSPAEISALCQNSEKYIQSIVADVKMQILQKAKSGKLSHVEKPTYNWLTGKTPLKAVKPHYTGGVSINYYIDISRSVLDYKKETYNDEGSIETRMVYTVSDYAVLEYMVKRVVQLLAQDKIYPIGGLEAYKWDVATILERGEVKKHFKEARARGMGYRHSLALTFAMFM